MGEGLWAQWRRGRWSTFRVLRTWWQSWKGTQGPGQLWLMKCGISVLATILGSKLSLSWMSSRHWSQYYKIAWISKMESTTRLLVQIWYQALSELSQNSWSMQRWLLHLNLFLNFLYLLLNLNWMLCDMIDVHQFAANMLTGDAKVVQTLDCHTQY